MIFLLTSKKFWKDEQIETLFDDIKNEDIGYYVGNLLINTDASC